MPRSAISVAALLLMATGAASAQEAKPLEAAAYRAAYELRLDSTQSARGIDGARGRIAIETRGNACEGYTTNFRQAVDLSASGNRIGIDTRMSNYEDIKGNSFRFTSETYRNGRKDESVDGKADRAPNSITIALKEPSSRTITVDKRPLFPTEHMLKVIDMAEKGESGFEAPVYDGGEKGDKVFNTFTVIGKRMEPGAGELDAVSANDETLKGLPRWRVTTSYFEPEKPDKPMYVMSFDLYRNGVSRALFINYGDFAVRGELSTLEWLPQASCN